MKLKGTYKSTRKRAPAPAIIIIECPGDGWRSQPAKPVAIVTVAFARKFCTDDPYYTWRKL